MSTNWSHARPALMCWFAVDRNVGKRYLCHVRDSVGGIGYAREGAVGHIDVPDLVVGESIEIEHLSSAGNDDIVKIEGTAEVGREASSLAVVVHGNEDHSVAEFVPMKGVDVDVPGKSAAQGVRLHVVDESGASPHCRVREGVDVLDTAGQFTSQSDRAPGTFKLVVPDDDVLGGHVDPASVRITSRLDRDIVIASTQRAILDHHMIT